MINLTINCSFVTILLSGPKFILLQTLLVLSETRKLLLQYTRLNNWRKRRPIRAHRQQTMRIQKDYFRNYSVHSGLRKARVDRSSCSSQALIYRGQLTSRR
ncbi:hypothetical protein CEXT_576031 [Caerostris extrusa]|uniref:Ribosomal protein S14 n=1 Tax=Caerostris extrusa TaxID=172846 RepID=A0AAV4SH97_CAEEX|nr:hypothetical protein CEXT_576031 [Caerostris extrusa]